MAQTEANKAPSVLQSRLIIPKSFEQCLTYAEQIYYLYKKIEELEKRIDELTGAKD